MGRRRSEERMEGKGEERNRGLSVTTRGAGEEPEEEDIKEDQGSGPQQGKGGGQGEQTRW